MKVAGDAELLRSDLRVTAAAEPMLYRPVVVPGIDYLPDLWAVVGLALADLPYLLPGVKEASTSGTDFFCLGLTTSDYWPRIESTSHKKEKYT